MGERLFTGSNKLKLCLHFNLKQMADKERLTQIMLVTTINRQRIRVYTKLRIEPKFWDRSYHRCNTEIPMSMRERKRLKQINHQLNKLVSMVSQADIKLAEQGKYLSQPVIRSIVEDKCTVRQSITTPISLLYKQVDEYQKHLNRRGKRGIGSTQKTYYTALKRLENYCMAHKLSVRSFDDFDKKFFDGFSDYLYTNTYQKGFQRKLYTQNTVVNTLKVIKNLLHRAYDNEWTENNYFQKVQTILSSDVSEQVYLNEKEIRKLSNLKLPLPHERSIRDMFVVACYTALRISDIQKLNEAVIRDGVISLYQTKTKEQVEIPILKEIAPLIEHYHTHGFPSINICKANETIKELAKRCGISQDISYREHRGGSTSICTRPKWQLISFHTARRSCITNLYKRGYPINYIMTLSGHRSVQAFQRYMKATSKELMRNFVTLLKKEHAL